MSIAEPQTEVLYDSIRVYWRTHDEVGAVGWRHQTWWYVLTDRYGYSTALPVGNYLTDQTLDLAEVVVSIAEDLGVLISIDQVKVDTGQRTAEWARGF